MEVLTVFYQKNLENSLKIKKFKSISINQVPKCDKIMKF